MEERVEIDKPRVVTGRLCVTTSSETVDDFARASLSGERVEVSRERFDLEIDVMPQLRVEGDTTIIPVVEEIVILKKRLVLIEEIRIRRITTIEEIAVPVTLRKQRATIERIQDGQPNEEKHP